MGARHTQHTFQHIKGTIWTHRVYHILTTTLTNGLAERWPETATR